MEKNLFLQSIVQFMAENPSWVPEVFEAVTQGAAEAHREMQRRIGTMRVGLIASMSFVSGGQMSKQMREISENAILNAYNADGGTSRLSPCEYDALAIIKNGRKPVQPPPLSPEELKELEDEEASK